MQTGFMPQLRDQRIAEDDEPRGFPVGDDLLGVIKLHTPLHQGLSYRVTNAATSEQAMQWLPRPDLSTGPGPAHAAGESKGSEKHAFWHLSVRL